MDAVFLVPALTPHGHLTLTEDRDAQPLDRELAQRLRDAFARGSGHGLLQLGAAEVGRVIPSVFSYWREFGARYVTAICTQPDLDAVQLEAQVPAPSDAELDSLALVPPPMAGAEYVTATVLQSLWREVDSAFRRELFESKCAVRGQQGSSVVAASSRAARGRELSMAEDHGRRRRDLPPAALVAQ